MALSLDKYWGCSKCFTGHRRAVVSCRHDHWHRSEWYLCAWRSVLSFTKYLCVHRDLIDWSFEQMSMESLCFCLGIRTGGYHRWYWHDHVRPEFYGECFLETSTLYINVYWDSMLYPLNGSLRWSLDSRISVLFSNWKYHAFAIWLALNACGPDTGKDTGTEIRSVDPTKLESTVSLNRQRYVHKWHHFPNNYGTPSPKPSLWRHQREHGL